MNKDGLVDAVASKCGCNKKDIAEMLDNALDVITKELSKGGKVALTGFGIFSAAKRAARKGVNPKTGARIDIAARTVPKFKAGTSLKEAVK